MTALARIPALCEQENVDYLIAEGGTRPARMVSVDFVSHALQLVPLMYAVVSEVGTCKDGITPKIRSFARLRDALAALETYCESLPEVRS